MKPFLPVEGDQQAVSAFRRDFIRHALAVAVSFLLCCMAALLIDRLCVFHLKEAYWQASSISVVPLADVHPEPKEKLIYLSCLLILPIALLVSFFVFRNLLARLSSPVWLDRWYYLFFLLGILAILTVSYAGFSADNPFHSYPANAHDASTATNYQFYLSSTFLYRHPLWYLFVLFPAVSGCCWWLSHKRSGVPGSIDKLLFFLMSVFSWLCIATVLFINSFRFPYTFENRYDFSAVYYSVSQVFLGLPLVVDNFTNTYGLYPHFVTPLFRLFGLSILNFSALMALLTSLCFWLVFTYLQKNLHSRVLAFLGFTTIIFYTHYYFRLVTSFDAIFASQPIRLLFPVLSLCLAEYYLREKSLFREMVSLGLLATGVLWNPEFGAIAYLAFTLLTMYACLDRHTVQSMFAGAAVRLLMSAVMLVVVMIAYCAAVRLIYGSIPRLGDMFQTMQMFSRIGIGLLPMPLLHPWNIVALIYAVGLSLALEPLSRGSYSTARARIFLITLLGIGSFSYYQGRSHNWNLLPTVFFAILLVTFLADAAMERVRSEKSMLVYALLIICVLGGAGFQIAGSAQGLAKLVFETENRIGNLKEQNAILANTAFIQNRSAAGEQVFILARDYLQGLYFGLAERPAAIQPGLQELRLRSDLDRLRHFLINNRQTKVFYAPPSGTQLDPVVECCYDVSDTNGAIALMIRRPDDHCRSCLASIGIR